MRVGLILGITNTKQASVGEHIASIAEQADRAGFSTLTMPDHFTLRPESSPFARRSVGDAPLPAVNEFFEAYSTLSFIAARTKQIRLGTTVSGYTMRYPAVLVRTANTLDALSNGRAYLGIGASPDFGADEHQRMGMPFPTAGERVARLEEVLKMALQLWSSEDKPFEGKYYQLPTTIGNPFFIQRPHPPILIAGHGKKMLRVMAQYADAISIGFGGELDGLRALLDVVRGHCQELNRPYEQIQKTTFFPRPLSRDGRHLDTESLDYIASLAGLGIDEVFVSSPSDPAIFELLASELVPAVAKIAVAGR